MVLSADTIPGAHPYWYAHILGVFHAQIFHTGPVATNQSVQYMEFLWVCWYGKVPGHQWSFKAACLFKVGFIPDTDSSVFGFLDPSLVICGSNLIPAFNDGKTTDLLTAQTTAAQPPEQTEDWQAFYVIMCPLLFGYNYYIYSFVDCDMFMCYIHQAIAHMHTNQMSTSSRDGYDSRYGDCGCL
jgi:hypothetical protein